MELGHNIKGRRAGLGLSQDDLAAQVYVSRQTISSWENDKTYPDVQSLLLLSETFGVAVDALIKGDMEAMEKTVSRDARHVTHLTAAMIFLLIAAFVALMWAGWQELDGWGTHTIPTFVLAGVLWVGAMVAAVLIERIKKEYDVETYREILAFVEGREIDRSARPAPSRLSRPLRIVLVTSGAAIVGFSLAYGAMALAEMLGR